jgi:AraC-like DNA-binding protein
MQNIDMRVLDTGFSSSPSITLHSHGESGLHEFHYFLEGAGEFWNADVAYPVTPGTLLFSLPQEPHRAQTEVPGTKFLFYWVQFLVDGDVDGLVTGLKERFAHQSALAVGRGHAPAFEDIRRRNASREPLVKRSADYRFLALLCDLAGNGPTPSAPPSIRYVDEALSLMQASIHTGLDLDQLATKLGIDKSHFVRLFKRSVGVPPMRYFLGLRLDTAKHLLRNGDESLRAIALELGFHDEFHFSHQFKAHVGLSPQNFRHSW